MRYGYDGGGQVCSVKGVKQGVEFVYVADIGYDEYGQRTYMEYGNGVKTSYTYDEDRRWLSNIKTGIAGLTYQDMDYSFDAVGNVAGYVNDADGYRTEQHYEYDGLYQLTGVEGISVNRPSGYDQYRAEYRQRYTFDELGLGNMMRKESESTVRPSYDLKGDELNYLLEYEYDTKAAHRVTRIGERFYRYDGNGNVVEEVSANGDGETELDTTVYEEGEGVYRSDYGWAERNPDVSGGSGGGNKGYRRSYIWNERNLMSQSADSRYTVTYRYGSDGQRATKYARGMNESETMYFSRMWEWRYDEAAGGRERNSKHIFLGETRVVTKVLADASVVAGERESEYFYHSDHLGSAQLISDYVGREYERIEYTPYGETWVDRKEAVDTIELTYRFTGKEVDEETGLYYYGARYLDPRTSRWLSTDPALGEYIPGAPVDEEAKKANQNLPGMGGVFNVVNFQLYHYAGNNPVKYVDPDGRRVENSSSNWILLRLENGDLKSLEPGSVYDGEIDGILMRDGSTFKINDNNANVKMEVTDKLGEDGNVSPNVEVDKKGKGNIFWGNVLKWVWNLFSPKDKKKEGAGLYSRGDNSVTSTGWWDDVEKVFGNILTPEDKDLSISDWDKTLKEHGDEK